MTTAVISSSVTISSESTGTPTAQYYRKPTLLSEVDLSKSYAHRNYSNGTAGGAFVEIAKVDYTSATTTKSVKVTLTEDVFAAPNLPSNISTKQNQQNAQQHAEKTGPGKIGKRKKQRIREALRLRKIANGGGPSRAEEAKAHKKKTKAKKKAKKKAKEHPVATASVNSAPIVNSVSASNSVPVIERKNKLSKRKSRALVASGNTTSNPITID